MSALAVVYVIALIVGGGLLLISVFLGHDSSTDFHADSVGGVEADVSADIHHDADLSHNGSGISLAKWFSVQFAVYFLAVFGLIGTTMTYMAKAKPQVVLMSATIAGLIIGQVVHRAMRTLKRTSIGSDLTTTDYLKRPARVTIAIEPARRGEVAVASRNGERFLAAVARRHDDRFLTGDRVVVVGFSHGVAEVVSKDEFEFVTNTKSGENT